MSTLHLVRLTLDRRALLRVGARHRLGQAADDGALLHAGLSQLFATSDNRSKVPLQTFAVDDTRGAVMRQPDVLFLLAYAGMDERDLTAAMGPARTSLILGCETRRVPSFEAGQRLRFRTRTCPITRTRRPGARPLKTDPHGRAISREVDAFLHATLGVPRETPVDREEVYTQWLARQVERHGACRLEAMALTEFRRETMRRRGSVRLERPNAVMEGTLIVTDAAAFATLLARGVGRHRAYGFGMLLLRPAGP